MRLGALMRLATGPGEDGDTPRNFLIGADQLAVVPRGAFESVQY